MGESRQGLLNILADIAEKTGTEAYLVSRGGEETKFHLEYCGTGTDVYLAGRGPEAEARARLVRYLVESGETHAKTDRPGSLKSILLGEGGSVSAFRFVIKYNLTDGKCFAIDLVPDRRLEEAYQHVLHCLDGTNDLVVKMDDTRLAIVRFSGDGQSPYEFAQFLALSLYEELGLRASLGVGCEMKSFSEIAVSYTQAVTAVRLSAIFHSEGEVHSYREYLLVRMLEDVPESRLKDYMEQFRFEDAAEIFEDEDMLTTAEAFLESSLNVSETSRNLFLHRNTLMYRLEKIERITGLNIHKFSDAVTFRVITILHKLLRP